MLATYSHSSCATARLFVLKSLLVEGQKQVIITDSENDISILRSFAKMVLGVSIQVVDGLADYWTMIEATNGFWVVPSHILETNGGIDYLRKHSLYEISRGQSQTIDQLIEGLIQCGYSHAHHLGELATYQRSGSVVTITEATSGNQIHIEWFDTEIDSILEIDARSSERRHRDTVTIKTQNLSSTPIERKIGHLNEALLGLINNVPLILFGCDFLPYIEDLRNIASIHYTDFHRDDAISLGVYIPTISHIDEFLAFLRENTKNEKKIVIYTRYTKTVQEFVEFHQIDNIEIVEVSKLGMESCIIPESNTDSNTNTEEHKNQETSLSSVCVTVSSCVTIPACIITDDIIGNIFVRNRNKKSIAKHLDLLLTLAPGDLVVHREHGIALFHSVTKKSTGNLEREYLELHYAEGDKLFVPLTEIYRVSKYLGRPDVELTKLTGKEWEKTMSKTEEEIETIALDILETNARRSLAKGRSFAKFRDKEKEFQDAFAYEYTHDQMSAIEDVFVDMESELAMDRLISGDVGFGKTEVAMNAIYKAVLSGTQVAVISPLLVLAMEHYETFLERLSPFGIRIGIMTRMSSSREIQDTLERLQNGTLDVIVGTHRLLSEDVRYKRLGLLVIDEEHKFGVTHKERIKKIRAGVDILALSATPIPRSLNLALSGLKKISIIATPPKKKKPIETIITRWNESILENAIRHEISRGGQVIILHNRIRGMDALAKEIENIIQNSKLKIKNSETNNYSTFGGKEGTQWGLGEGTVGVRGKKEKRGAERTSFPDPNSFGTFSTKSTEIAVCSTIPRIIVTHGQMDGDQIEDRIHAFKKHEYDILISTTIIENGVNFLRANTIIIVDPEEFGLASLHQLRGRVGRKDIDAYCYLMYRKPELGKDEKERLITIANNTHLGAGFEIAMRDMEIRGAGDVLGIKQSGRSKDVGLTLYFRLLEERIAELQEMKKKRIITKIELDISYTLPDELFLSEADKLNFFREIESLETVEELDALEADMPEDIHLKNLFLIIRSRLILTEYGVTKLSKVGVNYVFDLADPTTVTDTKRFLDRFDSDHNMLLLSVKKIRVETRYWKTVEKFLESLI